MGARGKRRRQERGGVLKDREDVGLIADHVVEGARDGKSVSELMASGGRVLTREQVMQGVAYMIRDVQVEAPFPVGTKLYTVHDPIR